MSGLGRAITADLLAALPGHAPAIPAAAARSPSSWADAGMPALTAPGAAPVADAAAVAAALGATASHLARAAGTDLDVDGAALLTERERLGGARHAPASGRSLRGGTLLSATADGWAAINLSRPEDREALPALTAGAVDAAGRGWEEWLATVTTSHVVARGRLLGLAVGGLAEAASPAGGTAPFTVTTTGDLRCRRVSELTVLDLSRLWAGPLAGALLARAGARVIRLIDVDRPPPTDPADAAFEARLHADKEVSSVSLRDRDHLAGLLAAADVVITAMRPSALDRLPPVPTTCIHLALTAHGAGADRVGFGDDCAVAGGLVAWTADRPEFAGDAVADPLTGLAAATAALGMIATGTAGRVDVSLAGTAAWTVAAATATAAGSETGR